MIRRYPDWPSRLAVFMKTRRRVPFLWGSNDCATFAADAIHSITGTDIAAEFRGYSTEAEARQHIARYSPRQRHARVIPPHSLGAGQRPFHLEALVEAVAEQYRMPIIRVGYAQRGDLVLFESAMGQTLGVVSFDGSIASPGMQHMIETPIAAGLAAWKVG